MRNKRNLSRVTSAAAGLAALLVTAVPSFAQSPSPASGFVDYAALATTGQTEASTAAGQIAPVIVIVVAGLSGIAFAIKWVKRGIKSS